jgi:hypothetical protein
MHCLPPYFCTRLVPRPGGDEKGSRCESGAIPVAVILSAWRKNIKPLSDPDGKVLKGKPEDLPVE